MLEATHKDTMQPTLVRQPAMAPEPNRAIPILYEHTKRSGWGRAVCVWNRDGRRAFQFEDGKLRIIAQTHAHLLKRARVPTAEAIDVARDLRSAAGIAMARREQAKSGEAPLIDVVQQIALFRDDHPEGFADPKWKKGVRGADTEKKLKRHRDRAIALAQEKLSFEQLEELLTAMSGTEILERMVAVLRATDLVTKKDIAPLERLHTTEVIAVATTLRNVLRGDGHLDARMQRFIDTLTRMTGKPPRWQMATALPALIDPQTFAWIRPSAIREQAKSVAPGWKLKNRASGRDYTQACAVVRHVARQLCDEGMAPNDLMDVTDFIWTTLRPASRKRFAKLLATRRQETKTKKEEAESEVNAA